MKYLKIALVFFVTTVILAGCQAVIPLVFLGPESSIGKTVNFDYANTIVPKSTTKNEVVAGMGKSALYTNDGSIEVWEYEHRIQPGVFSAAMHRRDGVFAGNSTSVTVVFRGDIVVAVAGTNFIQDTGATVKFIKGETQLIPFHKGGGQAIYMPQAPQPQPASQSAVVKPPKKKAVKK